MPNEVLDFGEMTSINRALAKCSALCWYGVPAILELVAQGGKQKLRIQTGESMRELP